MHRPLLVACCLALLAAAPASAARTEIFAHRGGPLFMGPFTPENSLSAFRTGHKLGADRIELDAKLTSDRVPVVMHDPTLDRTTDCTGTVISKTAAEVTACRIDILGTEGNFMEHPGSSERVPTLAAVLAWAKSNRVRLDLEIKNQPTDSADFDASGAFAQTVLDAVVASGIPKSLVLIQSFYPPNIDRAKAAGFQTSYLTTPGNERNGLTFARTQGYNVLAPSWPVANPAQLVADAHEAGINVVPYTINQKSQIDAAKKAGVDGIITDDPTLAGSYQNSKPCLAAKSREKKAARALAKARKALKRAKTASARKKARARVSKAKKALSRARKRRKGDCTPARAL
jgi:glycerophosphoryl diester phosphodiesterase